MAAAVVMLRAGGVKKHLQDVNECVQGRAPFPLLRMMLLGRLRLVDRCNRYDAELPLLKAFCWTYDRRTTRCSIHLSGSQKIDALGTLLMVTRKSQTMQEEHVEWVLGECRSVFCLVQASTF